ncbi:complex I intermediate-associated protein 30-domain-containing protein [Bisporella sp. PMI_857]|nr:complex I intermediate-associated protein 30-domain-containing protein [Bisporella sp. PMI_857]
MSTKAARFDLYGGESPWQPKDWKSSDDRVRGGSSISHLTLWPSSSAVEFYGNLDIKTLGGAGFASQRTEGEYWSWDLSEYDGLEIKIEKVDRKRYTFILKNEILPMSHNGREQSTTSWEYDFQLKDSNIRAVSIDWKDFKPTYRGKQLKDARPLDLKNIRRISLIIRSFFGDQEGEFSLTVKSISAVNKINEAKLLDRYQDDPSYSVEKSLPRDNSRIPNPVSQQNWLA